MTEFSIDDVVIVVKAVDRSGLESMVSAYVMAQYQPEAIDAN